MGRKKTPPKSELQKRVIKVIDQRHKRDVDPKDKRSDTAILAEIGYSPMTKVCEVLKSKAYLIEHEAYYKNRKTPEQLQAQLSAKARKNLYEGMDDRDPKIKLEWTKMQFNQEDKEASRTKLELKDVHGNMMTLLGSAATDAIEKRKPITHITEVPNIGNENENG